MRSSFAKFYQSGAAPGEALNRLASFVEEQRGEGLFIFCRDRLNNPDMFEELHKQHVQEIRRQANLEEQAANVGAR